MALSYFELALPRRDIQAATADTFAQQSANNLAVLPSVSLRRPLAQAADRVAQARTLAQNERRLDLQADRQDYAASQLPYEIALGALGGGLRLYGGYRALQQQDEAATLARQQLGLQRETAESVRQNNLRLIDAYNRIRQTQDTQLAPPRLAGP